MKEKKSQYSIWAPIIRKKLKEEEKIKGRKLEKEERSKLIKKEKRKCRVKATVAALIAAAGITTGTKAVGLLEAPKENNVKVEAQTNNQNKKDDIRDRIKVTETPTATVLPKEEIKNVKDILAEYNYNIEEENLGYVMSIPKDLCVDSNDNYVFDYKYETQGKYISNDLRKNIHIDKMYTLINKNDDTIIASLGEVNSQIVNIDAKQIRLSSNNKEYLQGENKINLTKSKDGNEKSQDELKDIYNSLEKKYEQAKEQKEIEER